ncbi:hypothetical protein J6590_035170 [Homalodisca vitripennis]|nr:hypothetical protein J6590_035170 [Homalodisca vitripennis]
MKDEQVFTTKSEVAGLSVVFNDFVEQIRHKVRRLGRGHAERAREALTGAWPVTV